MSETSSSPSEKSPMISLEKATAEPLSFDFELRFPLEELDREPLVEITPVRFAGQVAPIEAGFSLVGDLAWGGKLECSRCLVPYDFRSDEGFSLVLYRHQPGTPEEQELGRDELDVYFYEEPEVPVAPIVEERIQMAVPMKPLCREDCRGLCPHCGADLNQGNCGCRAETLDPRWEALQKLKKV